MKRVKTARGKVIDMSAMAQKYENTRAVGNVPMNAKGDRLDKQGNVKQTIQTVSRVQHESAEAPKTAAVSDPVPKTEKASPAATPSAPMAVNETTHTRDDGSQYVEIEYDDGSIETKELGEQLNESYQAYPRQSLGQND